MPFTIYYAAQNDSKCNKHIYIYIYAASEEANPNSNVIDGQQDTWKLLKKIGYHIKNTSWNFIEYI